MKVYQKHVTLLSWVVLFLVSVGVAALFSMEWQNRIETRARVTTLDTLLERARHVLKRFPPDPDETWILKEEDVSAAIQELTSFGKMEGVKFLAITPGAPRQEGGDTYRELPVALELESSYPALGEFLAMLDELETGLTRVSSLTITPSKAGADQVNTNLTLSFFVRHDG